MTTRPLPPGHDLRPLAPADLPALHQLHEAVLAALPDPAMFRLFGGAAKFLADHLGARGHSLGVFAHGRLVAYGSLTRPAPDDVDNYACDLGWPPERAGRVALLSAAMVHPAHRTQGLHRTLIASRVALARDLGVPELLVRAAPANAVSRRTLLSHGFAVAWLGVQREGSLRHVLWRPIGGPAWTPPASDEPAIAWAAADDLPAQQRLLAEGWLGVRMRPGDPALGFVQVAQAEHVAPLTAAAA
ncbi:MAG TPA: GNAT family N-acetyltransferase, partial [Burkholderiaceae bacterium]